MFDQGSIIRIDFSPAQGQEMKGPHYALVVSGRTMNDMGIGWVCPITQGRQDQAREAGLAVTLMGTGTDTNGIILVHQMKSIDFRARKAKLIEKVPDYIREEVTAIAESIVSVE